MEETTEIGYGQAGCVYKPGFCKSTHKHPTRNYISKVMIKGMPQAEAEFIRYTDLHLAELDPEMKYFISDPELCNLSTIDGVKFESARREHVCRRIPKPYGAVNYVDGGQDLFVIINDIYAMHEEGNYLPLTKWNEYLHAFKNIFEGIKLLNAQGIYHLDVKPDNIVYDNFNKDAPPQFKLIDFGLSRTDKNPPTETMGSFKYIPPEMYMLPNNSRQLFTTKDQYNYFFNEVNASDSILILVKPAMSYYDNMPITDKYKKADIWALGMTLIDMYNALSEYPSYTEAERAIYSEIEKLTHKMINTNVHDRITIAAALSEYNKILLNIDLHFADKATLSKNLTAGRGRKYKAKKTTKRKGLKKRRTNKRRGQFRNGIKN